MSLRFNVSNRIFVVVLLGAFTSGFLACERQDPAQTAGDDSERTSDVEFEMPEVDVSGLTPGLRDRLNVIRDKVRQEPQTVEALGTLGAVYFVHGFPEASIACFEHATAMMPYVMQWQYSLGMAYERLDRTEKAAEAFQRALELDADYVPVYVRLAATLVEREAARAANLCQRALELEPENAVAMYTLGRCEEAAGKAEQALKYYEQALKAAPNYADAHAAASRLFAAAGDQDKADEHAQAAERGGAPILNDPIYRTLLKHGYHLESVLREALTLAQRGKFGAADQVLLLAADVDIDGVATRGVTGAVRDMEGRLEEAIAEYHAVLRAKPESLEARGKLADALARQGELAEAESEYRKILERNPDYGPALDGFSRLLMAGDRQAEAVKLIRDALVRSPDAAPLRHQLGLLLYHSKQDDEARVQLLKCLELSPKYYHARFFLGLIEERANEPDKAVEYWRQTVADAPGFRDAYLSLRQIAVKQGDYQAAEKYLRDGMRNMPDDAALINSLAWMLAVSPIEQQRNGEEALRLAETACDFTKYKQHVYIDTLAAAYAELGMFEEAIVAQRQALDLARQAENQTVMLEYDARLKLYEQKKPYRLDK